VAAKKNMVELDQLMTSQNRSMQQLDTENRDLKAKLASTEGNLTSVQTLLGRLESEHSTCESNRNALERMIAEMKGKLGNCESRIELMGNEKSGNAQKLVRLTADLRELQQQLENSQAAERGLKSESEARERHMKIALNDLQVMYEKALQEASDNLTAGRSLLNAAAGYVVGRKGVGMVVRTVAEGAGNLSARAAKSQDFLVKHLTPGGSALACGKIDAGDIVVAVDGVRIAGLRIEEVQNLILGPEATTVTITFLKLSPTGGQRCSVQLMRGDHGTVGNKPFTELAKEAIDALETVHHEADRAKMKCKTLEDEISDLKTRIVELESIVESREHSVSQLQAEISATKSIAAAFERDKGIAMEMLKDLKEIHCNCEEGRKALNLQIADLTTTVQV
jgi:chromosome segregation ATPase